MTDTMGSDAPDPLATPGDVTLYQPIPYRVDSDEPVNCPHCQRKNDTDASFCDQCGTKLAGRSDVSVGGATPLDDYAPEPYNPQADENVQCPECRKRNDPDAQYCDQDGTYLVGRPDVSVDGPREDADGIDDVDTDEVEDTPAAEAGSTGSSEETSDPNARSKPTPKKAPRESLIRQVTFDPAAPSGDGLTLEG